MWRFAFVGSCLVGCAAEDPNEPTDGNTIDTEDTDDAFTGPCVPLIEGPWMANGTCFGHDMFATLTTTGDDGCTFEFSDWSMAMSVPEGGEVAGEDVALTGPDWDGCSGTTDGDSITGGCNTGCGLEMSYDG
jgi:hypothetical protein